MGRIEPGRAMEIAAVAVAEIGTRSGREHG
jgi:hypothetical protein